MEFKQKAAPRSGLTASGYGNKIPTGYMVRLPDIAIGADRIRQPWRRMYAVCWSNAASFYVMVKGEPVFIRDADIPDTVRA